MPAAGQSNAGELRLKVADPTGLGVKSSVTLASEANQYRQSFVTDDFGVLDVNHLPLGIYQLSLRQPGFAPFSGSVEISSAMTAEYIITLNVAEVNTTVLVTEQMTLIVRCSSGTVGHVDKPMIEDSVSSLP